MGFNVLAIYVCPQVFSTGIEVPSAHNRTWLRLRALDLLVISFCWSSGWVFPHDTPADERSPYLIKHVTRGRSGYQSFISLTIFYLKTYKKQ